MKIDFRKLALSFIMAFSAGLIGSVFTFSKITTWYAQINKPEFTPPNFIFGPVWTLLYVILGISLYIVWNKVKTIKNIPVILFIGQLILNALWTLLFFGANYLLISYIEILVLWMFIIINIFTFYKISKLASLMLLPYLAWITFASFLNLYVWILN